MTDRVVRTNESGFMGGTAPAAWFVPKLVSTKGENHGSDNFKGRAEGEV